MRRRPGGAGHFERRAGRADPGRPPRAPDVCSPLAGPDQIPAATVISFDDLPDGANIDMTIATLSTGAHLITVVADDGQGGVATDSVTVRADLAEPNIAAVFLPVILK